MNILAVNDDGIGDGIIRLIEAFRTAGHHVLAVVPDRNRSGSSHSVTFDTSMRLREAGKDLYTYGGTPVDGILAALVSGGLEYRADAVVSGINAGPNLGTDILYSGTAAAARQGSLYGLPSVAFSVDGDAPYHFDEAALWAATHFDRLLTCWRKGAFINVNYPNTRDFSGALFTYPALRIYEDSITMERNADGSRSCFLNGNGVTVKRGDEVLPGVSDWEAVRQNKVSVSVVSSHPQVVEAIGTMGTTKEGDYGGFGGLECLGSFVN
ncbi:MAG: 5'/3'-nucleotidase SurE [Spirochaetaceae bacterium]|jgi:5'-nucleotidase|nr:5'/3'-nucleotidase SurE [Spirochaetaceae bacterium]